MPTTNPTPENIDDYLNSVFANANQQMQEARQTLQQAITDIDSAIVEKTQQLHDLNLRSVTKADAAALVAKDMRDSLREYRQRAKNAAASAARLSSHAPVSNFETINGDGEHVRSEPRSPMPLRLLFNITAIELAAIVLDDDAIDAFAADAIASTDAPDDGPSVAELAAQADVLADDLEAMHKRRRELRKQLDGFISIALSPYVPDSFFRRSAAADISPSPEPKVTQFDDSGRNIQARYGHTFSDLIGYRGSAEAQPLPSESSTYHILGLKDPAMEGDKMPTLNIDSPKAPPPNVEGAARAIDFFDTLMEEETSILPKSKGAELSGGPSA